jgi:hypothetical protein
VLRTDASEAGTLLSAFGHSSDALLCLHVKTVPRFNRKTHRTVAKNSTAFPRSRESHWFGPVELCIVPVHFTERQDLPREKFLSLLCALAAKP